MPAWEINNGDIYMPVIHVSASKIEDIQDI